MFLGPESTMELSFINLDQLLYCTLKKSKMAAIFHSKIQYFSPLLTDFEITNGKVICFWSQGIQ